MNNNIELILKAQKNEITEFHVYSKLAKSIKNKANAKVLMQIANDELSHYKFFKSITNVDIKPNYTKIFFYYWIARIFGITFGVKLLEKEEESAQLNYTELIPDVPNIQNIIDDEDKHEKQLIALIDEDKLKYIGSIVLGLNDALVELTGTLAGLTLAFQNTKLIALSGLITGIAASFSMGASEYLSIKSEGGSNAIKSAIYTWLAYIITVSLLITPYFFINDYYHALYTTLTIAVLIIFIFNYYISVAKDYNFKKRFYEMVILSLGIALLSFGVGYFIRIFLGVEV